MQRVMITNGGPHSAEDWAEATASHIVDIASHIAGERRGAAVKLQAAIIDILTNHHTKVQDGERAKIEEHGRERLCHDLDCEHRIDLNMAVEEIVAAAKGTPWEADFEKEDFAEHLRVLLKQHFQTNMQIERSWHADRNPDTPEAKAFRVANNIAFGE